MDGWMALGGFALLWLTGTGTIIGALDLEHGGRGTVGRLLGVDGRPWVLVVGHYGGRGRRLWR